MLNIRILFTNYDIITDFLNLAFCSEHCISIKHRILATFNINKEFNSDRLRVSMDAIECRVVWFQLHIQPVDVVTTRGHDSPIFFKATRKLYGILRPLFSN